MTQDRPSGSAVTRGHAARSVAAPPVLLALLTVLAGLIAAGLLLAPHPPAEDSASVGFARDMSRHHAQAVAMAESLRDRTDDPALRLLTQDISLTQQAQIGMLSAWLRGWGYTQSTSEPRTGWMGSPSTGGMTGMATPAQVEQLNTLPLAEAEDRFLALMVAHHTGGVAMAEAGVALAEQPEVVELARSIAAGQSSEIAYLQSLRAARGLPPVDGPDVSSHDISAGHDAPGGGPIGTDVALWIVVTAAVAALLWLLVDTLVRGSGGRQQDLDAAAVAVAGGAAVSSAVHFVLAPAHAQESAAYGLFFVLTALALALGAAVVIAGRSRAGAALVAGASLLLVLTYAVFRVVPPPGATAPEGIDAWGGLAIAAELVALAAAVLILRKRRLAVPAT